MDRMLVRNADGTPKLTQLAAPSSGVIWSTNSTSEQMGLGADPRLAGGLSVRIGGTAADYSDAIANCLQSDPSSVAATPSGQYECRRYLLFMPGSDGVTGNRIHVASFGVILKAYDSADPFQRLAEPTIVAARFLSSFQPSRTRAVPSSLGASSPASRRTAGCSCSTPGHPISRSARRRGMQTRGSREGPSPASRRR